MDTSLTLYDILAFFMIYSFLGWCMEVIFHAARYGKIVNRGFLNGACCPIYGLGMVAVIVLLLPIDNNLLLLFIGGYILCTLLELVGGWILFHMFHTRWWDYSKQKFNLGGYICLKFSILWGLACAFAVRVIHPVILDLLDLIPHTVGVWILVVLYAFFIADCIATVMTVTHMNADLAALDDITRRIHETSDRLTKTLGTHAIEGEEKLAEVKSEEDQKKEAKEKEEKAAQADLQAQKQDLEKQADALREKMLKHKTFGTGRLIRAFPNMKHELYPDALEDVKNSDK